MRLHNPEGWFIQDSLRRFEYWTYVWRSNARGADREVGERPPDYYWGTRRFHSMTSSRTSIDQVSAKLGMYDRRQVAQRSQSSCHREPRVSGSLLNACLPRVDVGDLLSSSRRASCFRSSSRYVANNDVCGNGPCAWAALSPTSRSTIHFLVFR